MRVYYILRYHLLIMNVILEIFMWKTNVSFAFPLFYVPVSSFWSFKSLFVLYYIFLYMGFMYIIAVHTMEACNKDYYIIIIIKVWSVGSRAQRPLPKGIVRHKFPSLSDTTWRNNGSSTQNGLRFEHHIRLTFTRWNWKCHVIIVNKADLSGLVVTMHSGLCEQYVKIPRPIGLGIWLPVSHAPSCIVTTNPSRAGFNPLIILAWVCCGMSDISYIMGEGD